MEKAYVTIQHRRRLAALKVFNVRTKQLLSVTRFGELGRGRTAGKPLPKSNGIVYILSTGLEKRKQPVFFVVNTNTQRVVKRIPLGHGADIRDYVLTPNENRVWFTDRSANAVKVINTHTNEIIHDIYVPSPTFLAVTPNGKFVWVMSEQGNITIIRTRTKKVVGTIRVPFGPFVFTPDGKLAYLGREDRNSIQLLVIDVPTRKVTRTIFTDSEDHIQGKMYITPNGARLVFVVFVRTTTIMNPLNLQDPVLAQRTDFLPSDVHGFQIFSITPNGIAIRNVNTLNVTKTIPVKHAGAVTVING